MKVFWEGLGGLDIIQRLMSEGNSVRWYNRGTRLGEGFVPIVNEFTPDMDEVVVINSPRSGKLVEDMRKKGYKVLGSSVFLDAMVANEEYTQQVMRTCDVLDTPVQVEGWFNGEEWVHHSFSTTVADTHLFAGDIGPDVGTMGSTSFFYRHARPRLVKDVLLKLTPVLKRVGHVGPVGVKNCQITPVNMHLGLLDQEVGRTLGDLVKGQARSWKVSFDFSVGVLLTIPPFPFGTLDSEEVVHIEDLPHFQMAAMRQDEDGKLVAVGTMLGMMTAQAPNIHEARNLVYSRIGKLHIPALQYRNDIGLVASKLIPQILREVADGNKDSNSNDVGERSSPVLVDGATERG